MGMRICLLISLSLAVLVDGFGHRDASNSGQTLQWTQTSSSSENGDAIPFSDLLNPGNAQSGPFPMFVYPADEIISSCSAFIDSFSEAAANYTACALKYARPITFCQQCVEHYVRANELYDVIMKGNPLNDEGDLCSSIILNSDRVQIIVRTGTFLQKLWNDCNCDKCFKYHKIENNTVTIKLTNDTAEFNEKAQATYDCFMKHSNLSKDGRTVQNSTVCRDCSDIYHNLNSLYDAIEKKSERKVCVDVVDMMNATRSMWSSLFECNVTAGSLWPVFILSALVCSMPIIFYGGTRAHGARMQKNLVTQRRRQIQDNSISVTTISPPTDAPSTSTEPRGVLT